MTSIQQIRAVLADAVSIVTDSQGALQHAIAEKERARSMLLATLDGSQQDDVHAAIAALTAVIELLQEAAGQTRNVIDMTEQVGARL